MKRTSITRWSKKLMLVDRKYAPGDTVLEGLENEARAGRKGLWADPQPAPPWEWRKRK
jgi:endonuclease YncB( thermonuclease family)